jgi:magnesium transporter
MSKYQATEGKAPGALIFVGEQKVETVYCSSIAYSGDSFHEQEYSTLARYLEQPVTDLPVWLDVTGIHDITAIEQLGVGFNLNPLILEDVLNTNQRPKVDEIDGVLFVVLKMLLPDKNEGGIQEEQVSFLLSDQWLVTFQEQPGDTFEPVRNRLRHPITKIRSRGLGYLLFALMDTIVDQYVFLIEDLGERIEKLEQKILIETSPSMLNDIKEYKKELHHIRRSVWPVLECVNLLLRTDTDYFDNDTIPFIRDLEDHVRHANDSIETYREMLTDLVNLYQSGETNKLNDVIRILTIFSVIFTPLTFLAGIYGMNFKYFPELDYQYAYPLFWATIISVSLVMILYFKRKGWLNKQDTSFRINYLKKLSLKKGKRTKKS